MSTGNFEESLSQQIFAGMILVGILIDREIGHTREVVVAARLDGTAELSLRLGTACIVLAWTWVETLVPPMFVLGTGRKESQAESRLAQASQEDIPEKRRGPRHKRGMTPKVSTWIGSRLASTLATRTGTWRPPRATEKQRLTWPPAF